MREAMIYSRNVCRGELSDSVLMSILYRVMCLNARRYNPIFGLRFFAFCKVGIRGSIKRHWLSLDVVRKAKTVPRPQALWEKEQAKPIATPDDEEGSPAQYTEVGGKGYQSGQTGVLTEDEIVQPDFEGIDMRERWDELSGVIKEVCSEREQMIFNLMYFQGFNLEEVGGLMEPPISRERVRQLHEGALKKVRCAFQEKGRLIT